MKNFRPAEPLIEEDADSGTEMVILLLLLLLLLQLQNNRPHLKQPRSYNLCSRILFYCGLILGNINTSNSILSSRHS